MKQKQISKAIQEHDAQEKHLDKLEGQLAQLKEMPNDFVIERTIELIDDYLWDKENKRSTRWEEYNGFMRSLIFDLEKCLEPLGNMSIVEKTMRLGWKA